MPRNNSRKRPQLTFPLEVADLDRVCVAPHCKHFRAFLQNHPRRSRCQGESRAKIPWIQAHFLHTNERNGPP